MIEERKNKINIKGRRNKQEKIERELRKKERKTYEIMKKPSEIKTWKFLEV